MSEPDAPIGIRERAGEWVATHPSSLPGRAAALRFGLPRRDDRREIAAAPATETRVLIAPANHAGQGYRWARALESSGDRIGARSLSVESAFDFPADAVVARRVFHNSPSWQHAQRRAAGAFTHVLVESLIPPFGRLNGRDLASQLASLGPRPDLAFVCHGTDVRRVRPVQRPLSPAQRQASRIARRHRQFLRDRAEPVFVTTPDLLDDVPSAIWLPVVIDIEAWTVPHRTSTGLPRVVHVPSSSVMKGTALISPTMEMLASRGVVDYTAAAGISPRCMPEIVRAADIVLDQFVLGSYGVAACEAMASGAVVVGHVAPEVRERVRSATGRELPVVEATPESLEGVVVALAEDEDRRAAISDAGRAFVTRVHGGALSADILRRSWIDDSTSRSTA